MTVEECRLPAMVPVKSAGTDGIDQSVWQLCGVVVPVAATIVPLLLSGAYRHYGGTGTTLVPSNRHYLCYLTGTIE